MTSWKSWRQRKYRPIIIEHPKELSKWRIGARILYERWINYPNSRLCLFAAFGAIGLAIAYTQGIKWSQRRLYASQFTEIAMEKFKAQKKLISLVGEPMKFGCISPSYKDAIRDDSVDIVIPVQGSRAEGVMLLEAHKAEDSWVVDDLSFEFIDEAGGVVQIIKSNS